MIYKFLFEFSDQHQFFNLFQYITFRSFLAFFTSFFTCLLLGHFFIKKLNRFGEKINTDSPNSHQKKTGTPTMGGGFMLLSLITACLFWIDLSETLVLSSLFIIYSFALIGLWDDILKFRKSNFKGIKIRWRLFLELSLSSLTLYYLTSQGYLSTDLRFPFFKDFSLDLDWAYILFGAFVITGCANAVNLTDGLDGLAIFPVMICACTLFILSYVAGHSEIANYLNIPFIAGAGELSPLLAGMIACCLGFLWFNFYPAQVFMGDVGSLGLGSLLGVTAVLTKNEFLLVIFGGVFVAEALSVIFQVLSYKLTGKRIFKMAPLHHHFELNGLEESKIIIRFWIVSILLAILSLAALKIR